MAERLEQKQKPETTLTMEKQNSSINSNKPPAKSGSLKTAYNANASSGDEDGEAEQDQRNRKKTKFSNEPQTRDPMSSQDDWYKNCQVENDDDAISDSEVIDWGDDDDDDLNGLDDDDDDIEADLGLASHDKSGSKEQRGGNQRHSRDEFVDPADVVENISNRIRNRRQQQQQQQGNRRRTGNNNADNDAEEEENDDEGGQDSDNIDDQDHRLNSENKEGQTERCKYWPACNAGDDCSYYHPTKPCRTFPNCRFGNKCLYIHPTCKFGLHCTKPHCPFAHPATTGVATGGGGCAIRRPGPTSFVNKPFLPQVVAPKCRFGSNCTNRACQFTHTRSEPCRFGANCLLESCPFTHPSSVAQQRPTTSVFKWCAQS